MVRWLDELLGGLSSSSTTNQPPRNITKKAMTVQVLPPPIVRDVSAEVCRLFLSFFLAFFDSLRFPIHYVCIQLIHARIIRIHAHLLVLRPRPLSSIPPTPPLPPLRHAAPCAARPRGAPRAAGGTESGYAWGRCGAREGGGGDALG